MKKLHKAALIRAYRTFLQSLGGAATVGIAVDFTTEFNWKLAGLTILGIITTALISGCFSFVQSVANGLPEVYDDAFDEDELALHELQNSLTDEELGIEERAGE